MYRFQRQKLPFTYSTVCANFKLFESPIKTFKHSKGQSYTFYAEGNLKANIICPVKALWAYFQVRKPLLVRFLLLWRGNQCHRPVMAVIELVWLDCNKYQVRIWTATTVISLRVRELKITAMVRWPTDAFKKYIRVTVVKPSC